MDQIHVASYLKNETWRVSVIVNYVIVVLLSANEAIEAGELLGDGQTRDNTAGKAADRLRQVVEPERWGEVSRSLLRMGWQALDYNLASHGKAVVQ